MRSRLYGGLCFAVLAVALVAAGCGGDDDALTKSEFLKQADAICEKGDKEIDAAANKVFTGNQQPSNAEIEKFGEETVIPNIQGQVDGIRDLDPPADDEDQVNAILDAAQADLDKGKEDPSFLAADASFAKANRLAQDYGLTECGGD